MRRTGSMARWSVPVRVPSAAPRSPWQRDDPNPTEETQPPGRNMGHPASGKCHPTSRIRHAVSGFWHSRFSPWRRRSNRRIPFLASAAGTCRLKGWPAGVTRARGASARGAHHSMSSMGTGAVCLRPWRVLPRESNPHRRGQMGMAVRLAYLARGTGLRIEE